VKQSAKLSAGALATRGRDLRPTEF
jgi:hypothetical protein